MWLARVGQHARLARAAARAPRRRLAGCDASVRVSGGAAAESGAATSRDRVAAVASALAQLSSVRSWRYGPAAGYATQAGDLPSLLQLQEPASDAAPEEKSRRARAERQRTGAPSRMTLDTYGEQQHADARAIVDALQDARRQAGAGAALSAADVREVLERALERTPKLQQRAAASVALWRLAEENDIEGADALAGILNARRIPLGDRTAALVYAHFRAGDGAGWRRWARLYRTEREREGRGPSRSFLSAAARAHALSGELEAARAVLAELQSANALKHRSSLPSIEWTVFSDAVGFLAVALAAGRPLPAPPAGLPPDEAAAAAAAGGGEAGQAAAWVSRLRTLIAAAEAASGAVLEALGPNDAEAKERGWIVWGCFFRSPRRFPEESHLLAATLPLLRAATAVPLSPSRAAEAAARFGAAPASVADVLALPALDAAVARGSPALAAALVAELGVPDAGGDDAAAWLAAVDRTAGSSPFRSILAYKAAAAVARASLGSEAAAERAGPEGRATARRWLRRAAAVVQAGGGGELVDTVDTLVRLQAAAAREGASAAERAEGEEARGTLQAALASMHAAGTPVSDPFAVRWCSRLMEHKQWPAIIALAPAIVPLLATDSARGRVESVLRDAEQREMDRREGKQFVPFVPSAAASPQPSIRPPQQRSPTFHSAASRERHLAVESARTLTELVRTTADKLAALPAEAIDPTNVPPILVEAISQRPRFTPVRTALVGTLVRELMGRGDEARAERVALCAPALELPIAAGVVLPIVERLVERGDGPRWRAWFRRFTDSRTHWAALRAAGRGVTRPAPADGPAAAERGAGAPSGEGADDGLDRWEGTLRKAVATGALLEGGTSAEAEAAGLAGRLTNRDEEWIRLYALEAALGLAALPQREAGSSAPLGPVEWRRRAAALVVRFAARPDMHPKLFRDWSNRALAKLAPDELVAVFFAGREVFEAWPGPAGEQIRFHWWASAATTAAWSKARGFLRATEAVVGSRPGAFLAGAATSAAPRADRLQAALALATAHARASARCWPADGSPAVEPEPGADAGRCLAAAVRAAELVADHQDVGHVIQLLRPLLEARAAPGLGLPAATAVVDALVRGKAAPVDGLAAAIRLANLLLEMRQYGSARAIALAALRGTEGGEGKAGPSGGGGPAEGWAQQKGGALLDGQTLEPADGDEWEAHVQVNRAVLELRHIARVGELAEPAALAAALSDLELRLRAGQALEAVEFFHVVKAAELARAEPLARRLAALLLAAHRVPAGIDALFAHVNHVVVLRHYLNVPRIVGLLKSVVSVYRQRSNEANRAAIPQQRDDRLVEHAFRVVVCTLAYGDMRCGAGPADAEDIAEWLQRLGLKLDYRAARALVRGYERLGMQTQAWRCETEYARPLLQSFRRAAAARSRQRPPEPGSPGRRQRE